MPLSRTILGLAAAACLTLSPAYADSHGSKPPTAGKPTTTGKPSTSGKSSGTTSGSTSTTSGSPSTTSSTSSTSPTSAPLNPIAAKISSHPQLNAKVTAMLPAGMTLDQASKGFRNQGQFIAALHAAQNLDCTSLTCFGQLKTDMTRKGMSLGQAIQDVKQATVSSATLQAAKARQQADRDVKSTTTTTSTSTSTSTTARNKKKTTHAGGDQ